MLAVAPKTLRHWLADAGIEPIEEGSDSRLKLLTLEQLYQLARLHRRSITPPSPADLLGGQADEESRPLPTIGSPFPTQEQSLPLPKEEEWRAKWSQMETRQAQLQEQVTQLALVLLQERDREYERRLAALEAHLQQALQSAAPSRHHKVLPAETERCSGRSPHPAEKRTQPQVPLIEYTAQGSYVVICPKTGKLELTPDSPEWFEWLASQASFRFLGKLGRLSASRVYDRGPKRCWYAYRTIHQRDYKHYLGATDRLTITSRAAGSQVPILRACALLS